MEKPMELTKDKNRKKIKKPKKTEESTVEVKPQEQEELFIT